MRDLQLLDAPPGPPLAELAALLPDDRHPVLLESAGDDGPLAAWNLLAFDPALLLQHTASDEPPPDVQRGGLRRLLAAQAAFFGPPDACARAEAGRLPQDGPPFRGGALALLGYDLGRELERLPATAARDASLPDLHAGLYAFALAERRRDGRRFVVGRGTPAEAERVRDEVAALGRAARPLPALDARDTGEPASTFDAAGYEVAVGRVLERIRAGDLYQVNLSQRFELPCDAAASVLQQALARRSPTPFGALFRTPGFALVSTSPELFLRRRGDRLLSRPIKGTRPRGRDAQADQALRDELESSAKEHAELAMIVDLVRNDLGRSAAIGSVSVELPFVTESWSTVFHRVAVVACRLPPGADLAAVIGAAFPPASVTGAPKIAAQQTIDRLEPVRRHFYTGALGWFDAAGDCDLSVAIRIATLQQGRLLVPVGGGLTVASNPRAEYEETLHKARAVFEALRRPLPGASLLA